MKNIILLYLLFSTFVFGKANISFQRDSLEVDKESSFEYKKYIIPLALTSYGFIGLSSSTVREWDLKIKNKVSPDGKHQTIIDDYLQFMPSALVYGLNLAGVNGKNNFRDRTTVLATSYIIMTIIVQGIKHTSNIQRPDGSAYNSFPSGHTATAFVSAEFLRKEYEDVSIWYGVSGYLMAATTGYLRMYNNKHWFSDVVAGAGVGILSTQISYLLYPKIRELIYGSDDEGLSSSNFIMPYFNSNQIGIGMHYAFNF